MIARLLICPSVGRIKKEIQATLASHSSSGNTNHPDILYLESETKLGIAEARKIKEHFALKPYQALGRVVIIENASEMTLEAQNALLKTIEELPRHAVFILGAKSEANLLPTILSRCQIIYLSDSESIVDTEDVEKLLGWSIEERFEYVEKLKNREEFLSALVAYFHQNILDYPDFTAKLLITERWARQNVNIRAILEYLMLVMPSRKS